MSKFSVTNLTIKNTAEPVATNLNALDRVGKYGSFSRVTGFVRKVLTLVSNSEELLVQNITVFVYTYLVEVLRHSQNLADPTPTGLHFVFDAIVPRKR